MAQDLAADGFAVSQHGGKREASLTSGSAHADAHGVAVTGARCWVCGGICTHCTPEFCSSRIEGMHRSNAIGRWLPLCVMRSTFAWVLACFTSHLAKWDPAGVCALKATHGVRYTDASPNDVIFGLKIRDGNGNAREFELLRREQANSQAAVRDFCVRHKFEPMDGCIDGLESGLLGFVNAQLQEVQSSRDACMCKQGMHK